MTTPTDEDNYRTRDRGLHGLLVALGITSTIAAMVIAFAYAASDGAIFGINTALTSLNNKPVDSSTQEQQQKVDQKEEPMASQVGSQDDLIVVEKPSSTDTRKVEVPSNSQSLQYVNLLMPAPEDETIDDTSIASDPPDNNRPEKLRDDKKKADMNSSNNSTIAPSPSQPATSTNPSELTKEEKKALKEREELEKKLLKEKKKQDKKLDKLLDKTDSPCPTIKGIVNDNIEVDGACQIDASVNGNIRLDAAGDSVDFDSGSLDGNI